MYRFEVAMCGKNVQNKNLGQKFIFGVIRGQKITPIFTGRGIRDNITENRCIIICFQ